MTREESLQYRQELPYDAMGDITDLIDEGRRVHAEQKGDEEQKPESPIHLK